MERNFYTDDFERLLKERSDEFRMYPSKRVWHSIYNDLHPGRKWPSVAVSLLLIAALLITGYWNSNNHTTQTEIIASNQLPAGSVIAENGTNSVTLQQSSASNNNNNIENSTTSIALKNTITTSVQNTASATSKSKTVTVKAAAGYNSNNNRGSAKGNYKSVTRNNNKNLIAAQTASSPVNSAKTFKASDNTMYGSGNPVAAGKEVNADVADQIINDAVAVKTTISKDIVSVANNNGDTENNIESVITVNTTGKSNDAAINDKPILKSSGTEKESALIPSATTSTSSSTKTTNKPAVSIPDKAWIDDYAFYNRSTRKKWKDRAAKEFYITPGVTYRNFSNNSAFDPSGTTANALTVPFNSNSLNTSLSQKPGIGLEAGIGFLYSLSKKLRVKAGIQANYTSYTIYGEKTNHPVLTTLRLTNINTGFPYLDPRTATLANSGLNTAKTHNSTLQVSIPLGFAFKLATAGKLEWYAGSTIQPSFVIRGNANLISDDRKNYVNDPSLLRRWNVNAGFETFIHYKMNGFTLQAGPQFRYQLLSTYANQYTINENLYNVGLKVGLIRNF